MKNIPRKSIVLWILAGLFIISAFMVLGDGNVASFIVSILISAGLAYWGWKTYKNPASMEKQMQNDKERHINVYIKPGSTTYHFKPNCSNMQNPKCTSLYKAKKRGQPCGTCAVK